MPLPTTKGMNKVILYIGGGAMSGVFSAGVLAKLLEVNFYDTIEAIYAGSSGAVNAAYFLARQNYSSVYWEELTHNFILPSHIPYGFLQLLRNRFISPLPEENAKNVIDIDYVLAILQEKKPLDIKKIREEDNLNFI